ncbi:hypothetical protein [Streptomyces sp. NPDC056323]|uniref:hypothetical protein n=1 Tax=unclassified Streptomyces TaxID=2593676 RepID=UPI0035DB266A
MGDAEVDDTGAVGGEQHVGRLEVAVDDARAVDDVQCLGHARDQQHHRLDGHRPASLAASRYPAMVVGSSPPSGWKT